MCVAEYQKLIYLEQLLLFGVSVSAVERHKASTVDIDREFSMVSLTTKSTQRFQVSVYISVKVYNMMIFKHGQIVPYMARPDRYDMTRQVVDLHE